MFKYVVVGKGMIGSAAAKYLSNVSDRVALIGPDEPPHFKSHNGVFASHYDSGRITRILDTEYIWALAAERSIETYPIIEQKSGIRFFQPVGCIKVISDTVSGKAYLEANEANGKKLNVVSERLTSDELKARWQALNFPDNSIAISERVTAGWIDPRKLVRAQLVIAKQNGAEIIDDTVVKITRLASDSFELQTATGHKYKAGKVIVAAGGFSNFNKLLPHSLELRVRPETILMARIDSEQAVELDGLPSIIWFVEGHPSLHYVYMVPPVQYPNGRYYLKMGGDRELGTEFTTIKQLTEWFHSNGGEEAAADFKKIMQELLPRLKVEQWRSKPCIIADTVTERPYIDSIEENLYVATGGCGAAAKSSDEFGRLAALCAQGLKDPTYPPKAFQAILQGSSEQPSSRRQFKF